MTEPRTLIQYEISPLGRGTNVIFLCASLAGVVFVALPLLLLGLEVGVKINWLMVGAALLLALVSTALAIMSGLRAFGPGLRLAVTNEGFKYIGLFRVDRVRWSEVEDFRLTKGDFIVRLKVRLKDEARGGARTLSLDVAGLRPPVDVLFAAFAEATGIDKSPAPTARTAKVRAAA